MRFLFGALGMFVLGGVGWWLGALWAMPAAVVLSAIGTGYGLYWGRKLFDDWLG